IRIRNCVRWEREHRSGGTSGSGRSGWSFRGDEFCHETLWRQRRDSVWTNPRVYFQVITYINGEKQVDCTVVDANRGYSRNLHLKSGPGNLAASQCSVEYDVEGDGTGGFFTLIKRSGGRRNRPRGLHRRCEREEQHKRRVY